MIGWPVSQFLTYPIAFLFPGYLSFKTVLSKGSDDDTRWLCYWLIVALFFFAEVALSFLIKLIPFYFEMKCVVLFYLQWNSAKKAKYIYDTWLEPLLTYIEPTVDAFIDRYSQQALEIAIKAHNEGKALMQKATEEIAKQQVNAAIEDAMKE